MRYNTDSGNTDNQMGLGKELSQSKGLQNECICGDEKGEILGWDKK